MIGYVIVSRPGHITAMYGEVVGVHQATSRGTDHGLSQRRPTVKER
jgi:hypothetical protein